MEKKELQKKIHELTKKAETESKKRGAIVIGAFTLVYFGLYCFLEKTPDTVGDVFTVLLVSLFFSGLHCGINRAVFEYLFRKEEEAENELRPLRKQLSAIERKETDELIEKLERERSTKKKGN